MTEKRYTKFYDMHSGGGAKTPYAAIFVELPEDQARKVFEEYFGLDCDNTTCDCCGPDFSIWETDNTSNKFSREGEKTLILTKEVFLAKCNPEHWPW